MTPYFPATDCGYSGMTSCLGASRVPRHPATPRVEYEIFKFSIFPLSREYAKLYGMSKKTEGKEKKKIKVGPTQRKILLLLLGGLALGLSRSPSQYFRVMRGIRKEWQEIDRQALERAIRSLYESKLVKTKDNRDGTLTLILSDEGKERALTYNLDEIKIKKPSHWDGKWRIVMFDVPERIKKIRDALRLHFKNMDFYEFQKSVFVHPYPCDKEIEYLVEFYDVRRHVRFILATKVDNEPELKKHFGL